jgi:thymidine phosphorylase
MGNDVLGLDVEVGNTAVMQKCDTLYQLLAKIHNVAAKPSDCESKI